MFIQEIILFYSDGKFINKTFDKNKFLKIFI